MVYILALSPVTVPLLDDDILAPKHGAYARCLISVADL